MDVRVEHLTVERTARCAVLGERDDDLRDVWFVLHGYGQLAADFLAGFGAVAEPGRLLVAPEGLSRFYTEGSSGKVGASWNP